MGNLQAAERGSAAGFPGQMFTDRPVIAILTRWSEPAPHTVHRHDRVKPMRAGVHEAGGSPPEALPLAGHAAIRQSP